ncbi:hypothetical protein EV359DRAFT_43117 [Lentinula novae-zelandiae]|nr:hypothetical protein EV359DRAFT_43117 [Lentinula novae-zelandiae]
MFLVSSCVEFRSHFQILLKVGAGIGGLSAAFCLGRAGHNITVLEKAPRLEEVGAGVQVGPNMSRLLIRWGLGPQLDQYGVKPRSFSLCQCKEVAFSPLGETFEQVHGAPYYHIHRGDLLNMLYTIAKPFMNLLLSEEVMDLHQTPYSRPAVIMKSGQRFAGDLIIGADGVHSIIKKNFGKPSEIKPTGDAAYRVTIPTSYLVKDPDLIGLVENPQYLCWMGPEKHIVGYCIRAREEYNLVMIHPAVESTDKSNDVERMRSLYKGWDTRQVVGKLQALATSRTLIRSVLNASTPLDSWVHDQGHIVLLGDACHPMLPYRAQGSAMAVEDAAALGEIFSDFNEWKRIPDLLYAFQNLRLPRVLWTCEASWHNRRVFHLPDGEEQEARDRTMRAEMLGQTISSNGSSDEGCENVIYYTQNLLGNPKLNHEQFGYDAELEARTWKQGMKISAMINAS